MNRYTLLIAIEGGSFMQTSKDAPDRITAMRMALANFESTDKRKPISITITEERELYGR